MPQAWQIHQNVPNAARDSPSALANLELHTTSPNNKPIPGPNSALVRIHAVSLNARDLLVLTSSPFYPLPTSPGLIPCLDGSGVVEAVGPGSEWSVGDRVVLHPYTWLEGRDRGDADVGATAWGGGDENGVLAEYRVVGDERLMRVPGYLSLEEASALPCAGGAACHALFFARDGGRPVGRGDWVVVQGTGGVSTFAIQLAAAAGATVIATSGSDEKLKISKDLGARYTINYRHTPEWGEEVLKITGGKGADLVLDVGGAGTIEQSLTSVRRGGLVSVVGILTPPKAIDIIPAILLGAKTVQGQLGSSKTMNEELIRRMEADKIHPVIAKVFEWGEAKEAYAMLMTQKGVGKIVIKGVPASV